MNRRMDKLLHGLAWIVAWAVTWAALVSIPLLFMGRSIGRSYAVSPATEIQRYDQETLTLLLVGYALAAGIVAAAFLFQYHREQNRGRGKLAAIKEGSRGLMTPREVK